MSSRAVPLAAGGTGPGARPWRPVVAVVGLLALVFAAWLLPVQSWILELVAWIRAAGAPGVAVYALGYVLATVTLLPGSILTLGAGFAYGPLLGTLIVSPVSVAAATLSFVLGRTLARSWVERRLEHSPKLAAIDRVVGDHGLRTVMLLRMSPLLPFNLLNYGLSLTRVRLRDYVLGSFLGMLPWTFFYVYLGSLVTQASALGTARAQGGLHMLVYWGGLAVSAVVALLITRMARRALEGALALDGTPAEPAPEPPLSLLVDDEHDRRLLDNVHPESWTAPTPQGRYNLVVIGGGTAGLVSAVGAAALGGKVAIVERQLMGGDCLNVGCVPSKAMIRAAHAAHAARDGEVFGVRLSAEPEVDFAAAMRRMRRLRADISAHDSARRLAELGIDVFFGAARFVARDAVEVDGVRLEFSRAVIATGARARVPDIPGLERSGYLTNETVFSLTALPRRTVILGAGPIGCELGQALCRFGSKVTIVARDPRVLPRDDPDAAAVLAAQLERDGVALRLGAAVARVISRDGQRVVVLDDGSELSADALLVATGRAPNVEGLGLDAAGVAHDDRGVRVDNRLRTDNRRIFAAGNVARGHQFTHAADAMARLVIENALFFRRKRASRLVMPWATYTDPEVAHVGMTADEAHAAGAAVQTFTIPLSGVDRAIVDGDTDGFGRVHVERKSGRILGATLVARHAGDMIGEMAVAITGRLGLGALSATIHPYPTTAEVWKRAGDAWNRTRLTPRLARVLGWVLRVRRR